MAALAGQRATDRLIDVIRAIDETPRWPELGPTAPADPSTGLIVFVSEFQHG